MSSPRISSQALSVAHQTSQSGGSVYSPKTNQTLLLITETELSHNHQEGCLMKRSRWQCAFSQRRPAEHFCLSLFCFSGLVIASCLLFEQPLQDFLTHLNLYLPSPPPRCPTLTATLWFVRAKKLSYAWFASRHFQEQ
jgi:hypothetical protein